MNKSGLYKLSATEIYVLVREGKWLKQFPKGFWQRPEAMENAAIVIKYLVEDILKWSENDIKEKLRKNTFRNYNLKGMMTTLFNDSPYKAINHAYPDKYKPWELHQISSITWSLETGREAALWLFEEKLIWSDEDVKKKLNKNALRIEIIQLRWPFAMSGFIQPNTFSENIQFAYKQMISKKHKKLQRCAIAFINTWEPK